MIKIYKDKTSGTYRYDFTINGRRHRGAIKEARNLAQARMVAVRIWDQIFNKKFTRVPRRRETSFTRFYRKTVLPHSKLHKRSHYDDIRTGDALCEFFADQAVERIGWKRIEQFKAERIRKQTRFGRKRSPSTVNRELSVLSKALAIAVKVGLIPRNPCHDVERFRVNNARARFLGIEEEARLFEALQNHPLVTDIVTIALNTGMRQREIFCLCWSDVDLGRGLIHVRATKMNKDRFVPINLTARALLERLSHSTDSVFPSPKTGRALVDVKRQFDRAKNVAGLQDFRFHDLRHTVATRLADNGVDIFTIASILGHSDIRTTWRYTHASDRARHAAVESLAKELRRH